MSYGPGPTPPEGYDPSSQHGYPPPGGGLPPSYPPNAPVGGYPQAPYGAAPGTYPATGMAPQAGGPMGYGPYPGGPGYPQPQNNGLKIALIVLLAVLVLGGAGVGTYFLLQKDDKPAATGSAKPTASTPQSDNGNDGDKQRDSQKDKDQGGELGDEDKDSATPFTGFGEDDDAPSGGGGGLPTSNQFLPLPRDAAPAKVGEFEAQFDTGATGYYRETDWDFYMVEWAKATPEDIKDEMRLHENLVNFGDIQCGEFVLTYCYAQHPRHPDVWLEVSGLGESAEDTSAFTKMLLEKLP